MEKKYNSKSDTKYFDNFNDANYYTIKYDGVMFPITKYDNYITDINDVKYPVNTDADYKYITDNNIEKKCNGPDELITVCYMVNVSNKKTFG